MSGIGGRLAEFRRGKGLSQTDFADRIGMKQPAYKNYETELRKIPVTVLSSLIDKYDLDIHWLLTGEKKKIPAEHIEVMCEITEKVLDFVDASDMQLGNDFKAKVIGILFDTYLRHGRLEDRDYQNVFKLVA